MRWALHTSHRTPGFVTLISVLVLTAIGTAVAVSLLLLGLSSSRTSFSLGQSNQAKALANACAEEVLEQIRESLLIPPTVNLTIGQGTCQAITSGSGQNRTIKSTGSAGSIVRKVLVSVNRIRPKIVVTSWQEVADL